MIFVFCEFDSSTENILSDYNSDVEGSNFYESENVYDEKSEFIRKYTGGLKFNEANLEHKNKERRCIAKTDDCRNKKTVNGEEMDGVKNSTLNNKNIMDEKKEFENHKNQKNEEDKKLKRHYTSEIRPKIMEKLKGCFETMAKSRFNIFKKPDVKVVQKSIPLDKDLVNVEEIMYDEKNTMVINETESKNPEIKNIVFVDNLANSLGEDVFTLKGDATTNNIENVCHLKNSKIIEDIKEHHTVENPTIKDASTHQIMMREKKDIDTNNQPNRTDLKKILDPTDIINTLEEYDNKNTFNTVDLQACETVHEDLHTKKSKFTGEKIIQLSKTEKEIDIKDTETVMEDVVKAGNIATCEFLEYKNDFRENCFEKTPEIEENCSCQKNNEDKNKITILQANYFESEATQSICNKIIRNENNENKDKKILNAKLTHVISKRDETNTFQQFPYNKMIEKFDKKALMFKNEFLLVTKSRSKYSTGNFFELIPLQIGDLLVINNGFMFSTLELIGANGISKTETDNVYLNNLVIAHAGHLISEFCLLVNTYLSHKNINPILKRLRVSLIENENIYYFNMSFIISGYKICDEKMIFIEKHVYTKCLEKSWLSFHNEIYNLKMKADQQKDDSLAGKLMDNNINMFEVETKCAVEISVNKHIEIAKFVNSKDSYNNSLIFMIENIFDDLEKQENRDLNKAKYLETNDIYLKFILNQRLGKFCKKSCNIGDLRLKLHELKLKVIVQLSEDDLKGKIKAMNVYNHDNLQKKKVRNLISNVLKLENLDINNLRSFNDSISNNNIIEDENYGIKSVLGYEDEKIVDNIKHGKNDQKHEKVTEMSRDVRENAKLGYKNIDSDNIFEKYAENRVNLLEIQNIDVNLLPSKIIKDIIVGSLISNAKGCLYIENHTNEIICYPLLSNKDTDIPLDINKNLGNNKTADDHNPSILINKDEILINDHTDHHKFKINSSEKANYTQEITTNLNISPTEKILPIGFSDSQTADDIVKEIYAKESCAIEHKENLILFDDDEKDVINTSAAEQKPMKIIRVEAQNFFKEGLASNKNEEEKISVAKRCNDISRDIESNGIQCNDKGSFNAIIKSLNTKMNKELTAKDENLVIDFCRENFKDKTQEMRLEDELNNEHEEMGFDIENQSEKFFEEDNDGGFFNDTDDTKKVLQNHKNLRKLIFLNRCFNGLPIIEEEEEDEFCVELSKYDNDQMKNAVNFQLGGKFRKNKNGQFDDNLSNYYNRLYNPEQDALQTDNVEEKFNQSDESYFDSLEINEIEDDFLDSDSSYFDSLEVEENQDMPNNSLNFNSMQVSHNSSDDRLIDLDYCQEYNNEFLYDPKKDDNNDDYNNEMPKDFYKIQKNERANNTNQICEKNYPYQENNYETIDDQKNDMLLNSSDDEEMKKINGFLQSAQSSFYNNKSIFVCDNKPLENYILGNKELKTNFKNVDKIKNDDFSQVNCENQYDKDKINFDFQTGIKDPVKQTYLRGCKNKLLYAKKGIHDTINITINDISIVSKKDKVEIKKPKKAYIKSKIPILKNRQSINNNYSEDLNFVKNEEKLQMIASKKSSNPTLVNQKNEIKCKKEKINSLESIKNRLYSTKATQKQAADDSIRASKQNNSLKQFLYGCRRDGNCSKESTIQERSKNMADRKKGNIIKGGSHLSKIKKFSCCEKKVGQPYNVSQNQEVCKKLLQLKINNRRESAKSQSNDVKDEPMKQFARTCCCILYDEPKNALRSTFSSRQRCEGIRKIKKCFKSNFKRLNSKKLRKSNK